MKLVKAYLIKISLKAEEALDIGRGVRARSASAQILTSSKIENAQSEENVSTAEVSAKSLEHHEEELEL
ncbi:hypothetical protein F8388_008243 [Cannabis sativa]|uniref:Uncharacterized protein n=1 Tax=Cannabis sativa TaxID=3483 RepID=A0A7J6HA42_CANSA|nr:hypothetical protein F8388_008243 [Cannabis sativa]KAF4391349.1 hypothetical protein G4B88_016659 [Cannabis sativa]